MKRFLILMISALILLAYGSALADEQFTLHAGIQFGMTYDEVNKLEQENDCLTMKLNEMLLNGSIVDGYTSLIHTTIAGYSDTAVWYYFDLDKKLYKIEYEFPPNANFSDLENSLKNKYGDAQHSGEFGETTDAWGKISIPYIGGTTPGRFLTLTYTHRYLTLPDNVYISIMHEGYAQENSNSFLKKITHYISYTLLNDEQIEKYINVNDDL